jgi:hypothetical protein
MPESHPLPGILQSDLSSHKRIISVQKGKVPETVTPNKTTFRRIPQPEAQENLNFHDGTKKTKTRYSKKLTRKVGSKWRTTADPQKRKTSFLNKSIKE